MTNQPSNRNNSGQAKRPSGRPPILDESWTKVTVVLFDRQIVELDRIRLGIREKTGAAVKRAEIIRAMVDAVLESGIDLTRATNEIAIKHMVTTKLRTP
jgi:hypothetical protein